jgi:hypothetical protein
MIGHSLQDIATGPAEILLEIAGGDCGVFCALTQLSTVFHAAMSDMFEQYRYAHTIRAEFDGIIEFTLHGLFHNDDGPAVIYADGSIAYWMYGWRHREEGPAVIYADGSVEFWRNNVLHNDDGPAVIYVGKRSQSYLIGGYHGDGNSNIDFELEPDLKSEPDLDFAEMTYVAYYSDGIRHRTDGPAVIYPNGDFKHWVDGLLHNDNGPAVSYRGGKHLEYCSRGMLHNENGPAVIYDDGTFQYFIHDEECDAFFNPGGFSRCYFEEQ